MTEEIGEKAKEELKEELKEDAKKLLLGLTKNIKDAREGKIFTPIEEFFTPVEEFFTM